jgi:hypothetical protein
MTGGPSMFVAASTRTPTESIGSLCPELVSRRHLCAVHHEREGIAVPAQVQPRPPSIWA